MPTPHRPPPAALRALRTLGGDIREAKLRRDLPMALVAERAFTSRSTLQRVERGDHTAGVGIYAAVLHVLGLAERLAAQTSAALLMIGYPRRVLEPRYASDKPCQEVGKTKGGVGAGS